MTRYIFIFIAIFATLSCESQRNTSTPASGMAPETTSNSQTASEAAMEEAPPMPIATNDARMTDADFVAEAAQSGMALVKLSDLAEDKAIDPEVKKFAVQMVTEHTRANAQLIALSREKKWTTPAEMNADNQAVYDKLLAVISDKFDQTFMDQMVSDHERAVALFEQGATTVSDPELKNYIANTTPALKKHLETARTLQRKIMAKK